MRVGYPRQCVHGTDAATLACSVSLLRRIVGEGENRDREYDACGSDEAIQKLFKLKLHNIRLPECVYWRWWMCECASEGVVWCARNQEDSTNVSTRHDNRIIFACAKTSTFGAEDYSPLFPLLLNPPPPPLTSHPQSQTSSHSRTLRLHAASSPNFFRPQKYDDEIMMMITIIIFNNNRSTPEYYTWPHKTPIKRNTIVWVHGRVCMYVWQQQQSRHRRQQAFGIPRAHKILYIAIDIDKTNNRVRDGTPVCCGRHCRRFMVSKNIEPNFRYPQVINKNNFKWIPPSPLTHSMLAGLDCSCCFISHHINIFDVVFQCVHVLARAKRRCGWWRLARHAVRPSCVCVQSRAALFGLNKITIWLLYFRASCVHRKISRIDRQTRANTHSIRTQMVLNGLARKWTMARWWCSTSCGGVSSNRPMTAHIALQSNGHKVQKMICAHVPVLVSSENNEIK